jgi:hypothetical protein
MFVEGLLGVFDRKFRRVISGIYSSLAIPLVVMRTRKNQE